VTLKIDKLAEISLYNLTAQREFRVGRFAMQQLGKNSGL